MIAWNSPPVLAQSLYAFQSIMWVCIGVFAYDCCHYISFDWSIVRGTRQRKWAHGPYLFAKLSAWAFLICCLVIVHSGTEINCKGLMRANQVLMGLNMASCSMLLAIRASCVYTGTARKVVNGSLAVLLLGVLAVWLEGTGDVVSVWNTHAGNIWQDGLCIVVFIPRYYSAKHIVTIVFDLVVMTLTIVGALRMNSSSRIGAVLIRQGILYFFITCVINSINAALTLADLNTLISIIGGIPACVVCVMCATRLTVDLAKEAKPRSGPLYFTPTTSSASEKLARLFSKGKKSENEDGLAVIGSNAKNMHGDAIAIDTLDYGQSSAPSSQPDGKSEKCVCFNRSVQAQHSFKSADEGAQLQEK